MTLPPDHSPDRTVPTSPASSHIAAAAIVVWLLAQLTSLALSAGRVPLWYRAPAPVERVAVEQMLAVQLATAALLLPWLMRNLATAICIVATSMPFVVLAAGLAEVSMLRAVGGWGLAAVWLVTGAMTGFVLRASGGGRRAQSISVAVATALTLGVPVVRYLQMEFFHSPPPTLPRLLQMDPITASISVFHGDLRNWAFWLIPFSLLLVITLTGVWKARRSVPTTYPQRSSTTAVDE